MTEILSLPESRHRVGIDFCPGVCRLLLIEMARNSSFFDDVSKLLGFGVLSSTSDLVAPATVTFRQSCDNLLPSDFPLFALFREVLFCLMSSLDTPLPFGPPWWTQRYGSLVFVTWC